MTNIRALIFQIFLLASVSVCLNAYAQLTPQEAIEQMGRGINLGNTLDDPTGEGTTWPNVAKESLFDAYAEAGFTCVRIPITWNSHVSNSSPYIIEPTFLERVAEVVGWAQERGMWVVINAHHEDWLFEDPSQENFDRLDSIWRQTSEYFKDHSDSLVFETLNEPRDSKHVLTQEQVDNLNERILYIIRKTNPTRKVIIGGMGWASKEDLMNMKIPQDDYLIGYFHQYNPWDFAGEGNGTWGTSSDVNTLRNGFATVKQWSEANNIPVYVGEFSARTKCDYNSRMKWFGEYVEACLDNGFAFSVWDDNGWFQILERSSVTWTSPKDILIYYSNESPNAIELDNYNADSVVLSWTNRTTGTGDIIIERGVKDTEMTQVAVFDAETSSFVDTTVEANKTYYYRLKTIGLDSKTVYSYPQKVYTEYVIDTGLTDETGSFWVYPLPIENVLNVDSNFEKPTYLTATLYSLDGITVYAKKTVYASSLEINTGFLLKGVYVLELASKNTVMRNVVIKN